MAFGRVGQLQALDRPFRGLQADLKSLATDIDPDELNALREVGLNVELA